MKISKPTLRLVLVLAFSLAVFSSHAIAQWRPSSQVGLSQTPPLRLTNLSGQVIDITHYRGKVLIINFWASWCEPCRAEFEELMQLQENDRSKGLVVFAVNLAEMKPRINQFLKGNGFPENTIEILMDRNSTVYKTWKARGLPTTYLINKAGKIEGVWIGAIDNIDSSEVTEKIETLLRQ